MSVSNFSEVDEIDAASDKAKPAYHIEENFISLVGFPL